MHRTEEERWDRSWMHRLTARFGHRAVFVWFIAVVWIIQAVSLVGAHNQRIDHLFHTYLPVPVRVCVWLLPAITALAVTRTRAEWVAFMMLAIPPAERCGSYWTGATIQAVFANEHIAWDYVGRGSIYFVIVLLMWLVATWPNPIAPQVLADEPTNTEG